MTADVAVVLPDSQVAVDPWVDLIVAAIGHGEGVDPDLLPGQHRRLGPEWHQHRAEHERPGYLAFVREPSHSTPSRMLAQSSDATRLADRALFEEVNPAGMMRP